MRKERDKHINLLIALILIIMLCILSGCSSDRDKSTAALERKSITGFSDLEHARIGVMTGSVQTLQVEEHFPNAEIYYFTNDTDMLNALRAGKIDAYASAEVFVKYMMTANPDLAYLDEWLSDGMQVGAVFPKTEKGQALCNKFNEFISESHQNGVYEDIQNTWFGQDESRRVVPDLDKLSDVNSTLKIAVDPTMIPFVYVKDNNIVGIDIDIVVRFCKEYGYRLEVAPMDFSGIIPSVVTGKVDFASCGIAYTSERAESVLFSEPTCESHSVIAILKQPENSAESGFLSSVKSSFIKTFIREDRWKLFLKGIGTTLIITLLSINFGTTLGFLTFMLCRNGNKAANTITHFCVWLVQGMPVVVLLMILYYIVFGSSSIPGTVVSVIAFTLVFGSGVYGIVKSGVAAIDKGQLEAAYTLGYTNRKAFFKIILPQAMPYFMPAYKGEVTSLIKATAVVGYIAVEDLTKMGDIVRSRTYEAFFPLIAVAVIYFILAALLIFFINKIELHNDPRKRNPEDVKKEVEGQ